MKIIFIFFLFFYSFSYSQLNDSILIRGIGKYYKGYPIELFSIQDYISNKEVCIGKAVVDSNGIFEFVIQNIPTQKLVIRSKKNWAYIYVQPSSEYYVSFPSINKNEVPNLYGNDIELVFYKLDSLDINYKILGFQNGLDQMLSDFFYIKNVNYNEFESRFNNLLDTINSIYKSDTNIYFRYFIKYSLSELQVLQNVYFKLDNYNNHFHEKPIFYENDAYMKYFNVFYNHLRFQLSNDLQVEVGFAIKKASPSLIMNLLSKHSTLKSEKIRELAMIKMLGQEYNSKDFSRNNIIKVLDSISRFSVNQENRLISKNLIENLMVLKSGEKAPDLNFKTKTGDSVSWKTFKNKFVYLHFFNPEDRNSLIEIEPLISLHKEYGSFIQFITISPKIPLQGDIRKSSVFKDITWPVIDLDLSHEIWRLYNIKAFPMYYLVNPNSYLIQAPALSPVPNGDYESIHMIFNDIQKYLKNKR